ncbi:hypothetical protein BpHYR1_001563 [Brachionus plicatilis]|uniref:Uncharacterized protein n=1 Tax=Brachionus plicatilis TaxID=10195 RepID=A0A3M7Q9D0_BRAPC|nr:hypothetical protein BpHYR1_001563 [Brachionus plicatilis]
MVENIRHYIKSFKLYRDSVLNLEQLLLIYPQHDRIGDLQSFCRLNLGGTKFVSADTFCRTIYKLSYSLFFTFFCILLYNCTQNNVIICKLGFIFDEAPQKLNIKLSRKLCTQIFRHSNVLTEYKFNSSGHLNK